jgi:hypothetical protein
MSWGTGYKDYGFSDNINDNVNNGGWVGKEEEEECIVRFGDNGDNDDNWDCYRGYINRDFDYKVMTLVIAVIRLMILKIVIMMLLRVVIMARILLVSEGL